MDVSAKIQSAVNESRQIAVSYTVTDINGNVLFTSTPGDGHSGRYLHGDHGGPGKLG